MGSFFGGHDLQGQGGGFFGNPPPPPVGATTVYDLFKGSQGIGPDPGSGGEGYGWMDGGTNSFPLGDTFNKVSGTAFGVPSVMCGVNDAVGFSNSFGAPADLNYCFVVYGTQAQTLFTSVNFPTAQFAGNHTYLSASAYFNDTYTFNGQAFSIWMWATTDHDGSTFFNGLPSTVLVTFSP